LSHLFGNRYTVSLNLVFFREGKKSVGKPYSFAIWLKRWTCAIANVYGFGVAILLVS